jgi:predicted DCC family thiol-disulfide oxidoreductase YuxK
MSRPELIVWFDGGCPLCRAEIDLMRRLDRRSAIEFIDVAQDEAICPIDRSELLKRFHAQERRGPILSGAAAFAAMWRVIPLLRPLGLIAQWPPVLGLLELAYKGFLRVRPAIQSAARRIDPRSA